MKKLSIEKVLAFMVCTIAFTSNLNAQIRSIDPPIMGWSSWNTYRVNINEDLIKKQADAMVSQGLKEVGYSFVNVDDGFFGYRDEKGVLHAHAERFPNGMKPIADYIHSLGLKAGLYSEAGANTCGSIWDADKNGIGVGLYGYERQDADLFFNQWGFDFIKIDYCGAGQQLELDEKERYTTIVNAIREVCDRNISLNICRWAYPGTWVKDLARSWRISGDIAPTWGHIKHIVSKNLYLSAFAGNGHYNDMDMLEVGRGLKPEEDETHFGLWCIMSSPLMIGCDLTTIPETTLKLLTNPELIALNQDPLGLQAYVAQYENGGYTLVKDIEQKRGKMRAVALYNPTDTICTFRVPLSTLELSGKTKVRDLVLRKDERPVQDFIMFDVVPHGVKILRVEGEKRIEPIRYEAEQAYLNLFDDLGKRKRGVTFMPSSYASGKMTVINLGGQEDNYAQWDNVYSEKGGQYLMDIYYVPIKKGRSSIKEREINDYRMEISVNGNMFCLKDFESEESKGIRRIQHTINLKKGYNTIKIGSRYTWVPDLDCFTLTPKK